MASSPPERHKFDWRRARRQNKHRLWFPLGWLFLSSLLYLSIGTLLAAFPVPYWIWNLALGGIIIQALALAGPKSLGRFNWWRANIHLLMAILGAGLVAAALGIALGFIGTDKLDDIEFTTTLFEVLRVALLAFLVPAISAIIAAETGDRLLALFGRLQTSLILAATCILGIGLGGLIGLLLSE